MLAALLSVVAALLYAVASVLQHRAAVEAPAHHSLRPGLLAHLVAQPWWVAGVAADLAAFAVQFLALGHGPLVIVQPVLVSGLLFALPLGAAVSGARIRATELWASAAVVAGLAVLLLSASPDRGRFSATGRGWVLLMVLTVVPAALFSLAGVRWRAARAGLLATAAGVIYGLTAALAKTTAHLLGVGIGDVLRSWELWALIPAGLLGMVVCQSAFQAGPLRASLPALTAVDPVVSILIGILAFHEHVSQDALRVVLEAAGTAVMVAGVVVLGRSPLVTLGEPEPERSPTVGNDR